ncbi:hypothetical protein GJ496_007645 [Pomphorhynchus laevis]|nr:hypothetical protein GJ496_007645 [Pomphorhynchus laevis]
MNISVTWTVASIPLIAKLDIRKNVNSLVKQKLQEIIISVQSGIVLDQLDEGLVPGPDQLGEGQLIMGHHVDPVLVQVVQLVLNDELSNNISRAVPNLPFVYFGTTRPDFFERISSNPLHTNYLITINLLVSVPTFEKFVSDLHLSTVGARFSSRNRKRSNDQLPLKQRTDDQPNIKRNSSYRNNHMKKNDYESHKFDSEIKYFSDIDLKKIKQPESNELLRKINSPVSDYQTDYVSHNDGYVSLPSNYTLKADATLSNVQSFTYLSSSSNKNMTEMNSQLNTTCANSIFRQMVNSKLSNKSPISNGSISETLSTITEISDYIAKSSDFKDWSRDQNDCSMSSTISDSSNVQNCKYPDATILSSTESDTSYMELSCSSWNFMDRNSRKGKPHLDISPDNYQHNVLCQDLDEIKKFDQRRIFSRWAVSSNNKLKGLVGPHSSLY